MSTNGYEGGSSGRVTMKDVYDVVGSLANKVDSLKEDVQSVTVSHEHRLTGLEVKAIASNAEQTNQAAALQVLRDEHNTAKGHVHALAWVAGAIGTIFCGFGAIGLAHLLHW